MTEQEILYNAYNESGVQTNEEVMQLLGWSNDKVRNIKAKLKSVASSITPLVQQLKSLNRTGR